MGELKAKVAYLQGMSAGLDFSQDSKEGKLLKGIIEVLDEFAETVGGLEQGQEQLEEYVESLDEDLYHLEDDFYENSTCEEGEYLEVDCPKCGETVCFDSDILDDDDIVEVTCPNCDVVVFVNDGDHSHLQGQPEMSMGRVSGDTKASVEEDI
ncbi:MAG: AraC family transcriptional regulator [Desulfotomaculaceae bacterium]|nr:AraC family transcriptional regulator [Desulfotomaculaceae bacterium]